MRIGRVTGVLFGLVVAAGAGCADDERAANRPRPPAAINVDAAITGDGITVSPRRFGAGPIVLLISNQTTRAQELTFETAAPDGDRPALVETTSPINPSGTAAIELDLEAGRYRLSTADRRIRPAAVRVGAERPSAQDDLLTP